MKRFLRLGLIQLCAAVALSVAFGHAAALSRVTLMTPTGQATNDFLGTSVSSAGDVNGDGYADLIVGADHNDAGGTDAGRAYVYFGGPGADAVADLTLTGAAGGDLFGHSVASAGDVNGDGYDDVIVGAPQNSAGGSNAGRAYVFFGGPGADAVPDLTLTGAAAGDFFGDAVASAGDVNGDGYADVIVGARLNDAGGADAGRAYIFYGGPSPDAVADLTLTGAAAGDQFGCSVASAGDVNGDGRADVIVGARFSDAGGTDAGRAYVYYGGPGIDAVADLTLTGVAAFDFFGQSVSSAGDANGDGYADLLVGAYGHDVASDQNVGQAYLYYGGPAPDAIADVTMSGSAGFDNFGISVGSAGDVNGDGYADLVVGALVSEVTGTHLGRASIFLGGSSVDSTPDLVIEGIEASDNFGGSVGTAGDVNGDGHSDVIVGAANNGATDAGRAYVFGFDSGSLSNRTLFAPTGSAASEQLGSIVRTAGDVNKDGYADVIVGHDGVVSSNHALVYFGGPGADAVADLTLTGPCPSCGDGFGRAVSAAGDFNGDGYDDVIVGSFQAQANRGQALIFYGGPGADGTADVTLTGDAPGDRFGISVAAAGDVNGDGYADVIVGADLNAAGGTNAGRAYVFYGGPSADTTPDLTITGAAGAQFGWAVESAGDMNGDGFRDLIVGTRSSHAYVYYGGSSPDTTADLTFTGSNDQLGSSVHSAGDVNGDGYADVVVGAPTAFSSSGRTYVYYGGPGADNVADLTLTGLTGEELGISVSSGDVNGDGFSDVIVGTAITTANPGRAYIFYGGPSSDNVADITLIGPAVGDRFGQSVDSAGDINGDGLAEIIAGANLDDSGGTNAGRAYVISLDRPPSVSSPIVVVTEERAKVSFAVHAADGDGDPISSLTADLSTLPPGNDATFTPSGGNTTGTFTWNPASGTAGTYAIVFTAANTLSRADTTLIRVTSLGTTIIATFSWQPTAADVGTHDVLFHASNVGGESGDATTHVTVTSAPPSPSPKPSPRILYAAQRGPIISAPPTAQISAGSTLSFSVSASSADTLTANTTDLPTDNTSTFTVDREPVVSAPASWSVDPATPISFIVTAADPDTNTIASLTADFSGLPPGNNAVFTPNGSNTSGTFSWTPTVSDNGVYVVNFRAANALVDLATTAINVGNKLRGYWTLDGSGTDGATGHMLVASGGVTYAAGHLGPAADVSGAAAGRLSVSAPGSDYDLTSGGFTFECWLNSRSLAFGIDPRIAFAGTEGGTPAYWEIHVCDEGCTTGRARVRVVAGVSVVELQSNATIADGTWHHVATTYDGTKLRLYVDGVADDSLSQSGLTIATSGGSFSIGARPSGANQFDGLLDDVRLWGRARTQSEIQTYMNRELGFPAGVDGNAPRFSNHLGQNRPNPFNPDTRIDFELEHSSHVRVVVFDVSGRRVATLLDREMSLGPHQVTWDGRDDGGQAVGSGIYFYRIEALGFHRDRKMVLLK